MPILALVLLTALAGFGAYELYKFKGPVKLLVTPGLQSVSVHPGQVLTLELPPGGTFSGLQVDTAPVPAAAGRLAWALPGFAAGQSHVVYALWTSAGIPQVSSITLSVA
jgi:hypothetical protein